MPPLELGSEILVYFRTSVISSVTEKQGYFGKDPTTKLKGLLLKIPLVVTGGLTKEICLG